MHLAKAENGYTVHRRGRALELVEPRLKSMENCPKVSFNSISNTFLSLELQKSVL